MEKHRKLLHNNKFNAPIWSDEFELNESFSISGINDYFEYVLKKMVKLLMIHQSKYM